MSIKSFKQIRILIDKECEKISKLSDEIEIDESYFFASAPLFATSISKPFLTVGSFSGLKVFGLPLDKINIYS